LRFELAANLADSPRSVAQHRRFLPPLRSAAGETRPTTGPSYGLPGQLLASIIVAHPDAGKKVRIPAGVRSLRCDKQGKARRALIQPYLLLRQGRDKRTARPSETRHHGTNRHSSHLGNLTIRQPLDVAQDHGLPVGGRQSRDGRLELPPLRCISLM
jgi:hypothetical protein